MDSLFVNSTSQLYAILMVVFAALLGGVIGLERELARKPVGIRTMMIVAGTSAMLMLLGLTFSDSARNDPLRIIQAIVMGIGFIGAGTILRHREGEQIEGLTTAATILLAAAIGISVALKQFILAVGITVLTLFILIGVRKFERRMHSSR